MKLETKDILEFINNNQDFEVKFDYLELDWGIDYNLYSRKLNVTVTIMDSDDNFATDEALYIDYVYLDDGMKAWQVQINSKFLKQEGIDKVKELLPKFFVGEVILPDYKLVRPLHPNCNFSKLNNHQFDVK